MFNVDLFVEIKELHKLRIRSFDMLFMTCGRPSVLLFDILAENLRRFYMSSCLEVINDTFKVSLSMDNISGNNQGSIEPLISCSGDKLKLEWIRDFLIVFL